MRKLCKKLLSAFLAAILVTTVLVAIPDLAVVETDAAGTWNGTNYGGGSYTGTRTFLEAYGIDYDTYIKWMDDHDNDSANPNYYLGTPYVGYDHRNPHGDRFNTYGSLDRYGVEGMNCTGFVWHVQYKAAVLSGATRAQINSIPVMGNVLPTWNRLGIYRVYFSTKEQMLKSGILEKGDIFWIYGSGDNHHAIFYGNTSSHDRYWHSSGKNNNMAKIHSAGTWGGCWVAKCTQPNKIELQINPNASIINDGKFGAKYCIFTDKTAAQNALNDPDNQEYWDQRTGTIVLDKNGRGCLRTDDAPSANELWKDGVAQTDHSYFNSIGRKVDAKITYYAVQYSAPEGMDKDTEIHEFTDSRKRTSTGYRIFSFKIPKMVDTPAISKTKSISDGVRLSWNSVESTGKYRVYSKGASGWTRLGETTSTSFVDKTAVNGETKTYTIRCVDADGDFISNYNTTGWKHTHTVAATPQITSLTSGQSGITLEWQPVEGVVKYRAYRQNSSGSWTKLTETTDCTYTDTNVNVGTKYIYTVRCLDGANDFISDFNHDGWEHTYTGISAPQITSLESTAQGVKIRWNAADGADKYRLFVKAKSGWTKIADTDALEYLDTSASAGSTYTYTLRCIDNDGKYVSGYNASGWTISFTGVGTPQITSLDNEPTGIRLKWAPIEGTAKYSIYHKKANGGWTRIAVSNQSEYLDESVSIGSSYTYTVRCLNNSGSFISDYNKNGWSKTYTGVATPSYASITDEPGGVRLRWNAIEGVGKYRLYVKKNNSWSRIAEVAGTEYLLANVEYNTTNVFTIRCADNKDRFISDYNKNGWSHTYKGVATPLIDASESVENGLKISWDPVEGAARYRVYLKDAKGWHRIGETAIPEYTDQTVTPDGSYTYTVRCLNDNGNVISDYDRTGHTTKYEP